MTEAIRQPALPPPPINPATPRADDPSALLETHYRSVWETRMRDLPFVNAALAVEAIGFRRCEGDWLGVVVTPWFLNLVLIAGGGSLWGDIPAGQRRYLNLPCGTLQFIADDDPEIGPYQYCPLIAPVSDLPDMAAARHVAADALKTVFGEPAVAAAPPAPQPAPFDGAQPAASGQAEAAGRAATPATGAAEPDPSRRGFFRRLAGKRN